MNSQNEISGKTDLKPYGKTPDPSASLTFEELPPVIKMYNKNMTSIMKNRIKIKRKKERRKNEAKEE